MENIKDFLRTSSLENMHPSFRNINIENINLTETVSLESENIHNSLENIREHKLRSNMSDYARK